MSRRVMPDEVERRIVRLAELETDIRALLLIGSRARVDAPVDALSDHDVVLYVTDPEQLLTDRSWLTALGTVLVQVPPAGLEHAWPLPTRLAIYEDGAKVDFTIRSVDDLRATVAAGKLPPELDDGYRVLVDKDAVAAKLPAASGKAYVLNPPTQAEFSAVVEEFWWETSYVAKNLRRDELLPARYSLEYVLKLDLLRRMLEWRVALDENWNYRSGVMGRGLKRHLSREEWSALEHTYASADAYENWDALSRTITLFRSTATLLARRLGLDYPDQLDEAMTEYLDRIRQSA